ncbi:patatin-like phospholipase family protein [Photobacterium carnosum]|uniref:Phospholipase n=1 Tax=Photobacterium carnosum TaxID=2023717 RepID=A0A2N4UMI6_9GAMM|nr:patatin-like phospholipase family protein [Photobacterium carnosum]KAE8177665.1 phospholipase [Photobacterium carnosum]MCD9494420.1 phospholipase [Photobacterium carnosum]MCD9498244.1 phospholipase [Photobacterium carnosum]MCD9521657.1 phospholipase [Photobacterium carnosum]MCD9528305.1 phospholipase [Photobacterium carnosum]
MLFSNKNFSRVLFCIVISTPTVNVYAAKADRPIIDRPKIGLVLSGGGAKGAAHIGVLEVLEENRIPVDIVTGTSMGAYVGGMYAMGLSAQEVKQRTFNINWNTGYIDRASRNDLSLRRKKQNDTYQLHTDLGLDINGEFKSRPGAFQGQGLAVILRKLTANLPALKTFDRLAIPYRSVATDITKVTPVVISSGHLATAMQASMTVPGALKPVHLDNKLLVDGGVVNNMPVDVAKQLGADVIIAVDLRDSLMPKKDLDSALNIVSQLTTFMTNASADFQKSLMKSSDIYLQPNVSFMTAADFDKLEQAYQAGRKIALASLPRLLRYQLSLSEYAEYNKQKNIRRSRLSAHDSYFIDDIEIINNTNLPDKTLLAQLELKTGKIISNNELEQAVKRLQSEDIYGRINYSIKQKNNKNILVMDINEKSWGPGYLNFTLAFEDDFESRSDFSFGAQYVYTDLTDKGGEWLLEWKLGSWKNITTEFYFPIDYQQHFFTAFGAETSNEIRQFDDFTYYNADEELKNIDAKYNQTNAYVKMGWNIKPWAAFTLGYKGQTGSITVSALDRKENYNLYGPYLDLTYDDLDSFFFPSYGSYFNSEIGYSNTVRRPDFGESEAGETVYYNLSIIKPFTYDKHTVVFSMKTAGSDADNLLPIYAQDLGGLFNLSGYHRYELNGRYSALTSLVYRYRVIDNNFGAIKLPIYIGGSLEKGGVWDRTSAISWDSAITAGSVYVAVDSILGPVYLSYGQTSTGKSSFYLSLGGTL